MNTTPKSLRLQIGIFGRTNVGKSSFLNMVAGQDVSITSDIPGTTTDVVEKCMELLPIGPVVLLDTAGINDVSALGALRVEKTKKIFDRSDLLVLIAESNVWTEFEEEIIRAAAERKIPCLVVVNKIDTGLASGNYIERLTKRSIPFFVCSSIDKEDREMYVDEFKRRILELAPQEFFDGATLLGDLIKPTGIAVLIIPIDTEAPKGRIILPQAQAIRSCLDADSAALVVKESEYALTLNNLKVKPDLVVCDSQVVERMVKETSSDIPCTTFSILLARMKGDLTQMVVDAFTIDRLKAGDKILIAESCSHHPLEDDIGRVKIPRWLREYTGLELHIDSCAGHDYPENLKNYALIIHCGGCMITKKEMYFRARKAAQSQVPITNYGVAISFMQGVLERVLAPFPDAYKAFIKAEAQKGSKEKIISRV
jgi:[FeFe] hydrogenase H-cluster maturation GTPase HydF